MSLLLEVRRFLIAIIGLLALSGCARSVYDELEAAMRALPYRPIEGRLSRSQYAMRPALRTANDIEAKLDVQNPALRRCLFGESEELRARALLLGGRTRHAKSLFANITSRKDASAVSWSDYAAVLLADAATDDALQLATALAATDRALDLSPNFPEALFNRAITLEALAVHGEAARTYKKYLEVDSSSQWAMEVRERLYSLESRRVRADEWRNKLSDLVEAAKEGDELFINDIAVAFPQESRAVAETTVLARWGECVLNNDPSCAAVMLRLSRIIGRALEKHRGESLLADAVRAINAATDPQPLAQAHLAYENGRQAHRRRSPSFRAADLEGARQLFQAHRSPMAYVVRFELASLPPVTRDAPAIATTLRKLSGDIPNRYRALRAQVHRASAQAAARAGFQEEALDSIREAEATFAALGDEKNVAVTRSATASLLAASGDTVAAWRLRHASLVSAADAGDEFRLAESLYAAAGDAIRDSRWNVAHALLNVVASTPYPNEYSYVQAMAWRVVAAKRAGMPRTAAAHLRAARASRRMSTDLVFVEALTAENPADAVALLTQALNTTEEESIRARLLVERARAFGATSRATEAQGDLERAVALLDRGGNFVVADTIRNSVLGSPADAYCMLADTLDAQGQTRRALEVLDHYRTRVHAESTEETIRLPFHVHDGVPAGALVITYGVFSDRLVIYANSTRGLTRVAVSIPSAEVEQLVAVLDESIPANNWRRIDRAARGLYRILVKPIQEIAEAGDTLVFVRDPALGRLSFAALLQNNGRYLIEDYPVVVTHSAAAWLRSLHTKQATSRALLSVGNPLSSDEGASLAQAEAEAKEIAAMYPSRALLLGAAATKQRVISALAYSDAAHFAVHANAGLGETVPPHLLLSETKDDDGRLTAAEIAALKLTGIRTVILAGCRTAVSIPGSSGTRSLVDAFLAAGAGSVVGTLWEVDDATTREMSINFHTALRGGSTPAAALRETQLAMIRRNAPPRVWAALQMYGSGS